MMIIFNAEIKNFKGPLCKITLVTEQLRNSDLNYVIVKLELRNGYS